MLVPADEREAALAALAAAQLVPNRRHVRQLCPEKRRQLIAARVPRRDVSERRAAAAAKVADGRAGAVVLVPALLRAPG